MDNVRKGLRNKTREAYGADRQAMPALSGHLNEICMSHMLGLSGDLSGCSADLVPPFSLLYFWSPRTLARTFCNLVPTIVAMLIAGTRPTIGWYRRHRTARTDPAA
jgi:hypothetical protein